ncbi:hypothetical protein [Streptomyces atriruber]|uniref:hypothetical protein n=1 Tax=Streptomyces atriruber TaxID=545121 RepID=UPI0006E3D237|nr:hypothetical protein [Streptomyces atriruber]
MTQGTIYIICSFLLFFSFMVARSKEVPIYQVLLINLGGFLLAMTPLGYPIWALFLVIGNGLFG